MVDNCFGKWNNSRDCKECPCRFSCKRQMSKENRRDYCISCRQPSYFTKTNRCIYCGNKFKKFSLHI